MPSLAPAAEGAPGGEAPAAAAAAGPAYTEARRFGAPSSGKWSLDEVASPSPLRTGETWGTPLTPAAADPLANWVATPPEARSSESSSNSELRVQAFEQALDETSEEEDLDETDEEDLEEGEEEEEEEEEAAGDAEEEDSSLTDYHSSDDSDGFGNRRPPPAAVLAARKRVAARAAERRRGK